MNPIIGIDLGTTFSVISKLDDHGQPTVNSVDNERILASCIYSSKNDPETLLVGNLAKNNLGTSPESVLQWFKRDMGTDKVYNLPNGKTFTPVSASAVILKKLVNEAEKELGPIRNVVITVPANFAEKQRRATIEAGRQAGLNVLNIINEPTAAVLAFASKHQMKGRLLVYDLGGGTFDVTIAELDGSEVTCLTSEGDSSLGGIDFDLAIANIIDAKHSETHGRTLRAALNLKNESDERNSQEWQILLMEAEEIKKALSKLSSHTHRFRDSPDGPLNFEITRSEFEESISTLIAKTEMRVETAFDNLDMSPKDIDEVLLVGGSTRIPSIKHSLTRMTGKVPCESINPDEAVSLGAAIYCGLRTESSNLKPLQRESLSTMKVTDVANHFYGTIAINYDEERNTEEDRVTILIRKDSPLPATESDQFFTRSEGQTAVNFRITQSGHEETDPNFVNIILQKNIDFMPPGRPTGQPIEFTYTYSRDQVMEVVLHDVNSGIKVSESYNLSEQADEAMAIPDFRIE